MALPIIVIITVASLYFHNNNSEKNNTTISISDSIKKEEIINSYLKGNTPLVKWIIKKTKIDYNLVDIAACKGDLHFLLWLHSKNFSATTAAMDGCCINGHYLVLKFLSLKRTEGFSEEAVYGALRNNHHDIYTWLYHTYQRVRNNSAVYEKFCKDHNINYPDTSKYF